MVTANYKLTFDSLRRELDGLNLWIVVLDTKGINVWCAAGKGAFGTEELAGRVQALRLGSIITHRTLILPQLGAVGVAAHEIQKRTGFKVIYGPVRACDIKAFLDSGLRATAGMRKVTFGLKDRAILAPIEFMHSIKYLFVILLAFFILNFISRGALTAVQAVSISILNFLLYFLAVLTGCIVVPILLPWIPFRSFSLKGLLAGLIPAAVIVLFPSWFGIHPADTLLIMSGVVAIPAITAFLALNFTGSTTYASFSGVKKEMKYTLPPFIGAISLGTILAVASKIMKIL
ncbi:MAG: mercury methylation corrinoid protein HgcA [Caulobacteraceae bacterium]